MQTITLPGTEGPITLTLAEFYDRIAQLYREGHVKRAEFLLDYERSLRVQHFYG